MQSGEVIRRVVLWRWREGVAAHERLAAKQGLAYLSYASPVEAVDFGEDLGLLTQPDADQHGNHALALIRDHRDRASWDAYDLDPHHRRVGALIDTLTHVQLTARADCVYRGPTPARGVVRHLALHTWQAGVETEGKASAIEALERLRTRCPTLAALEIGADLGWAGEGRADLVVEAHFKDREGATAFLAHAARHEAEAQLAALTDRSRCARIEHYVRSG